MEEEREDEEYPDWSEGDVSVVSESEGEMDSEDTDVGVSVDPVPSTSHATGKFYNPARSRCPLRAKQVPASQGTCDTRGARAHPLVARGFTRYDDEDEGNPWDQFPPSLYTCMSSWDTI